MADGELTLTLTAQMTRKLREAAEQAGMSAEDLGVEILAFGLEDPPLDQDHDPAIDSRIADEAIANGDAIPLDIFLERMKRFGRSEP
jgi:hypothetical protein